MTLLNHKRFYIESMATRPETFYTRKVCNYLIIRIKQLLFVQLLNACHADRQACHADSHGLEITNF